MKAFYTCTGSIAFISLIYLFGEINGIPEGNLLGNFILEALDPYMSLKLSRYYFLLFVNGSWVLIYSIINLKFSSIASKPLNEKIGQCTLATLFLTLLYLAIWPGDALRYIPLSHYKWPVNLQTLLYQEDGLLEMMTAGILLLASIQFYLAGRHAPKHLLKRRTAIALFILSILSMFFLMEEISWGQRIFSWNTPEAIKAINHQQETNLHNIFNPILIHVERLVAALTALAILITILFRTRITSPTLRGLLLSDKYYYLPILITNSIIVAPELFEESFATFLFFYSRDMWKFYSPKCPNPGPHVSLRNFGHLKGQII
jgi:hypothetical protein